ncbi:MAG: YciI family protein [Alphaproteobacteria bacterium]|nr:YciI family protein [Alphaproteobacteria bacterium]
MKYAVLVYETADDFAAREDQRAKDYWDGHGAYAAALQTAGVFSGGAGLKPPHAATTVRVRGGAKQVLDGPFADIKEQLGGFYLIDVENLDAALAWAEKCPGAATGSIEVRPLIEMNQ